MKTLTYYLKPIYMCIIAVLLTSTFSCRSFFDAQIDTPRLVLDDNGSPELPSDYFLRNIINTSAGFGWNSSGDYSQTAFCLGAGYQYRIYQNDNESAGYLGGFANYHTESADEFKLNSFKFGPKYTHYDRLTTNGEVDLTYALKGHYEIGSVENFGNKDDVTGLGVSAGIGVNFNISPKFSLGVETPLISYWEQTYKYDGGEIKQNQTSLAFNKNNPVMAYARFRF